MVEAVQQWGGEGKGGGYCFVVYCIWSIQALYVLCSVLCFPGITDILG